MITHKQDVSAVASQLSAQLPAYRAHWACAEKAGYSGVCIMTKLKVCVCVCI